MPRRRSPDRLTAPSTREAEIDAGRIVDVISPGATPSGRGYVPRKRDDVLALDMGDGVIVYDHVASLIHHLNPSASILWQLCDGDADAAELAAEIAEAYGLDRDVMAAQVDEFIRELDALGLIEDAGGVEEKDPASGGS